MIAQPFLLLNDELRVIAASPSFHETSKVAPAETLGRLIFELDGGAWDTPQLREALAATEKEEGVIRHLILNHPRLEALNVQIRSVRAGGIPPTRLIAIEDPALRRAASTGSDDITGFVPFVPPGVVYCGPEGQCVSLDARAAEICGVSGGPARGEGWLRHALPEDIVALRAGIGRAAAERMPASLEMRFHAPDREPAGTLIAVVPLPEPPGGFVLTVRDISTQKQMEGRLAHAQRMEMVGRMAGGIAHDFNNVLTAISSYAAQLLCAVPPASPALNPAVRISRLVDQAALITRQLLGLSRNQTPRLVRLNLNDVLRDMDELLFRTLGDAIEIKLALDLRLAPVIADRGQMQQMIFNLAINARDAMLQGGMLAFSTSNFSANGTCPGGPPAGDYVLLEVSDTGSGIGAAERERIFEPFYTTKPSGTGLGLAVVHAIVQQSGGSIEVDSEPGRGSRFRILLPRAANAPAPAAEEMPGGTETILLVEDAEPVRRLVRELLEARGYTVLEAADADDAVLIADSHQGEIQLLLTDLVMPTSSGHELAMRLRRTGKNLKVIYMSGNAGDFLRSAGADGHFLDKPFKPETLVGLVRSALDQN